MSIFNSIRSRLFGNSAAANAPEPPPAPAEPTGGKLTGMAQPGKFDGLPSANAGGKFGGMAGGDVSGKLAGLAAGAPAPVVVDVAAILDDAVKAKGQTLNWRTSIVDLMRALDLDSSLAARRQLGVELNYNGAAADGTPEKNMWLHKELMKALAENGGNVPAELLKP